jgi:holo-[acyl-carrier protein] synthase
MSNGMGRHHSSPRTIVGTDLIDVESVLDSIRTFGDRYLGRVFTTAERRYCARVADAGGDSAPHFAARFAAKEAVLKVLRPSQRDGIAWSSIEIVRLADGSCKVRLHGAAQALARRRGLRAFSVSMSHACAYATATSTAWVSRRTRAST